MFGLLSFGLLRLVHLRNLFGAIFGGSLSLRGGALGGRFGRGRGDRGLFGTLFYRSFFNVFYRRKSRRENILLNLGGILFERAGKFWGFRRFVIGFTGGFCGGFG